MINTAHSAVNLFAQLLINLANDLELNGTRFLLFSI